MRLPKFWIVSAIALLILAATVFFQASSFPVPKCEYHAEVYQGLEAGNLSRELRTNGLIGRIHGVASAGNMVVLSVRSPDDFFASREFSLIAGNRSTRQVFQEIHRHDLVCIQGRKLTNSSPQTHILVQTARAMEKWDGLADFPEYEYRVELPTALENKNELIGKVHAIGAEGKILVVEYEDGILPIFVKSPELTQDLYRGDIIQLNYKIQRHPDRPTHLQLDEAIEKPLIVLDAIAGWHQQPQTLSGHLVQFPQSPQIRFDVYAIDVETDGIHRTFTLVNFEDLDTFQAIRDKLDRIWKENQATITRDRNALINPEVTITATGLINVVSPKQANPQILLKTVDDFSVLSQG
ncbi:MAG: hypothetical protein J7647_07360 [Cyanobacteria bacterium SBLK]|nr:hypothetical protein [Cyanobacteria bacterium SBLK]